MRYDWEKVLKYCFYHPSFLNKKEILGPFPELDIYEKRKKELAGKKVEKYAHLFIVQCCYIEPLLTFNQEQHLFKQYNYYKWRVARNLESRNISRAKKSIELAYKVRQRLVLSNTRLAINVIRGYCRNPSEQEDYFEDAYVDLFRIVDRFDWRKGNRFSTYATYALRNCQMLRYKSKQKELSRCFELQGFYDESIGEYDSPLNFNKNKIRRIVNNLTDKQRETIKDFFGLSRPAKSMTQIAKDRNVKHETIRELLSVAKAHLLDELKSKEEEIYV